MRDFAPETISEETLRTLIPIWKDCASLRVKTAKVSKAGVLLLEWIRNSVEYKVKKEILNSSQKQAEELTNSIENARVRLGEAKDFLLVKEQTLAEMTASLREYESLTRREDKDAFKRYLVQRYRMETHYELVRKGDQEGTRTVLRYCSVPKTPLQMSEAADRRKSSLANLRSMLEREGAPPSSVK